MARGGPGAPGPRPSSTHLTPVDMRPTQDAADADGPAAPQGCTISGITATHSHPLPVHAAQRRPRSPSVRPSVRPTRHLPFLPLLLAPAPNPRPRLLRGQGGSSHLWGQTVSPGTQSAVWLSGHPPSPGPLPGRCQTHWPPPLSCHTACPGPLRGWLQKPRPRPCRRARVGPPRGAEEWTRQVTHPSPNVRGGSQDGLWPRAGLGPGVRDGVYS